MDLLLPDAPRQKGSIRLADLPRLEIKRDAKGLVSVLGATQQSVTSAEQLMATVEQVCGLLGRAPGYKRSVHKRSVECACVHDCAKITV